MKKKDPTSHRIIEKRRRDRMNNCLTDLSRLIPSHYIKKGRGRVEKTEIIEMAIKYLKDLIETTNTQQRLQQQDQNQSPTANIQHNHLNLNHNHNHKHSHNHTNHNGHNNHNHHHNHLYIHHHASGHNRMNGSDCSNSANGTTCSPINNNTSNTTIINNNNNIQASTAASTNGIPDKALDRALVSCFTKSGAPNKSNGSADNSRSQVAWYKKALLVRSISRS